MHFLQFFSGAEVPAHIFHPRFLAKYFSRFSLEGFRNFAPEVSPEISGGPEIPALGSEVPAQVLFGFFWRYGSTGPWDGTTGPAGFRRVPLVGKFAQDGSTTLWAGTTGPAQI